MGQTFFYTFSILMIIGFFIFIYMIFDLAISWIKRNKIRKANKQLIEKTLNTEKIAKEYRKRLSDGTLRKKRYFKY